jgi:hypothetical protein
MNDVPTGPRVRMSFHPVPNLEQFQTQFRERAESLLTRAGLDRWAAPIIFEQASRAFDFKPQEPASPAFEAQFAAAFSAAIEQHQIEERQFWSALAPLTPDPAKKCLTRLGVFFRANGIYKSDV